MIKPERDFPPDWQEQIIELGKQGGSKAEVMALLNLSRNAFYALLKRDEDFAHADEMRDVYAEAWWTRKGREMAVGEVDGNTGAWVFNMKNRFGWRDRIDHTTGGKRITEIKRRVVPAKKPSG